MLDRDEARQSASGIYLRTRAPASRNRSQATQSPLPSRGREILPTTSAPSFAPCSLWWPRLRDHVIDLEIETLPCGGRTRLSKEDLTRVMLNLVRNASEAMPEKGKLRITAQYGDGLSFLEAGHGPAAGPHSVVIAVEDSGPGISEDLREEVFTAGFTTRTTGSNWPDIPHRGLGLTIVRSLIEAAGGTARACSSPGGGARFELELPITSGMYEIVDNSGLVADSAMKGCIECP